MVQQQHKLAYWDEAVAVLSCRDRILNRLICQYSDDFFSSRQQPAFQTLARALISAQSSVERANATWREFVALCERSPNSQSVVTMTLEQLMAIGIAKSKATNLLDLAKHFEAKSVNPLKWSKMSDEEVIDELCQIRGIGRWTAQMYLIFNLQRPNVLPMEDARLKKAISQHYFSGAPVSRFDIREVSENWQPWQTVATWYLWRSLD